VTDLPRLGRSCGPEFRTAGHSAPWARHFSTLWEPNLRGSLAFMNGATAATRSSSFPARAGGHELAGQHSRDRHAALPNDHRCPFRQRLGRDGRGGAKSGAASARRGVQDVASHGGAQRETPGFAGGCVRLRWCTRVQSGGDRIRTCDLEVMSLASYLAAPPRDR
jgi:hypothetical protein